MTYSNIYRTLRTIIIILLLSIFAKNLYSVEIVTSISISTDPSKTYDASTDLNSADYTSCDSPRISTQNIYPYGDTNVCSYTSRYHGLAGYTYINEQKVVNVLPSLVLDDCDNSIVGSRALRYQYGLRTEYQCNYECDITIPADYIFVHANASSSECSQTDYMCNCSNDLYLLNSSNNDSSADDETTNDTSTNDDTSTTNDSDTTSCDQIPLFVSDQLGWFRLGNYDVNRCTPSYQNEILSEGQRYYFSRTDPYRCPLECLGYQTTCPFGKVYSSIYRGCTDPIEDVDCSHTQNNTRISIYNEICQKQYLCDDGITPYESEIVECPVEDSVDSNTSDTTTAALDENNNTISQITSQQNFVNALREYGAATTVKQDEIIQHVSVTNQKLDTINEVLAIANNNLEIINNSLDQSNTIQNSMLQQLQQIADDETTNDHLADINDKLEAANTADVTNTELLSTISEGISDLADGLSESNGSTVVDSNATVSLDLGTVDTGGFDGAMSTMDTIQAEFEIFKTNIENNVQTVQNSYDTTKSLIDQGITVNPHTSITSCPYTETINGRSYTIDYCSTISPYSNLIYTLFYFLGLAGVTMSTFKLFFLGGD